MTIVVTGSHGTIGTALVPSFTIGGHRVVRLVRSQQPAKEATAWWDPVRGSIESRALEGVDAVVHLAGENLVSGRWTVKKKQRIRDSRVDGTRFLCEALGRLSRPPKVLVCASAIGYYGNRGNEELTEESPPGKGFLASVCVAWERAVSPAAERGIRVVTMRTGIVLTPAGGALRKMLVPFRLGLGGTLGRGAQYMSWVAMDDLLGAIDHALLTHDLSGPLNVVAPHPVTNRDR